ncbi:MAG TPA: EAL domain-containing protein [Acidiferrobacterales bacterium]|nr:EAL domain-containing protein [Acidiferrobacterales bacterium]
MSTTMDDFSKSLPTTAWSHIRHAGMGLVVGFSLLLTLMVLITLIGLGYMEDTQRQMRDIVEQRMAKLKLSTDMRVTARERTASLQLMTLLTDSFDQDEQWMKFNGQAGKFVQARTRMLDMPLSDDERQILAQQGQFTGKSVPLQDQVVRLIKSGRAVEAQRLLIEQAIPAQDRVLDQLARLQELQESEGAAALVQAESEYVKARRWVIGLSSSMFALGFLIAAIVVYRNIISHRALRRAGHELQFRATHDGLTGLLNRHEFDRRLNDVLRDAREKGVQHVICYLDIDMFKPINDTVGHAAGDELLRQMAERMRSCLRPSDLTARLGGDEFAIVFFHCLLEDGFRRAEELRRAMREIRFSWGNQSFNISVSIGIAQLGADSGTSANALSLVDDACRQAKAQGRNRTQIGGSSEDRLAQREDLVWVNKIRDSFTDGRLVLYAQPVHPIGPAAAPLHFEILVRLRDTEENRLVVPSAFLPVAERYHLMPDLDRAVIRASLAELARHRKKGGPVVLANINLSGQTLNDPEFLAFATSAIRESGVPPEWLCFEITETAAIANLSSAHELVASLRAAGCQFALDDFGSGVSSFGYLKNLKVDFIKIDGMFVKDVVDDIIDRAMVKSINEMAHVIGARTIAEYVENNAILEHLTEIQVDFAQGYGIGKPQPLEAVLLSWPTAQPFVRSTAGY